MQIIVDVRLLITGRTSGIEEYTRSLLTEIFRTDTENKYLLFYNGFRRAPLPAEWRGFPNVQIVEKRVPNKLLDLTGRFLNFPKVEDWARPVRDRARAYAPEGPLGRAISNGIRGGDILWSPHFNLIRTRLPHVITFHDLSFLHHPDFFSWRKRLWHWFQDCESQAKSAARLIAVSEFTKRDLMHFFGVPEEHIEVIYSGINADFKQLPKGDLALKTVRQKLRLDRPFILYLGTIEPRKNVVAIIQAFEELKPTPAFKDFELIIAGERGWLYDETFRTATTSPYARDIRFLGGIDSNDRPALYNLASLFIYPSFFEGFGFQPLEAQACGVPVIASNRTSLPEILGDSAILIDPWKVGDLAEAMKAMLSDETTRSNYIERGLINVKRFTWQKAAEKTRTILNIPSIH